jgi:serine/threonine protein kinase
VSHPQRLGKYQITDVLGQGAMGVVYKGYDPDIRRVVALKTIRRNFDDGSGSGETVAARFRNEAQAAGRLLHPGIVGVYDFGQDESVAYIAMEFVEGHTLAHFLSGQVRFTDDDILSVATQLLDALQHAHDHGVWHRDVKPANLIMTRVGKLKVADFGIARIDAAGLTQANSIIGTPMYMAPEQFVGAQIDHRIDLYATGVVLYQLIAGQAPFTGTPEQLMYKVVHDEALPPSRCDGAQRTDRWDGVIARAMAKHPDRRFATATAFREALVAAANRPVSPTVSDETLVKLPARPRAAGAGVPTGSTGGSQGVPTHWDPAVLAQAEHSLALHLGPLASVLVRRAARECQDLGSLYSRLAEQVTNPAARSAFMDQAARAGRAVRSGVTAAATATTSPGAAAHASGGAPTELTDGHALGDAALEQAQRALAAHLGPIARVVVRKAAEKTRQRDALFALLADAVTEPVARQKLLAELARIG